MWCGPLDGRRGLALVRSEGTVGVALGVVSLPGATNGNLSSPLGLRRWSLSGGRSGDGAGRAARRPTGGARARRIHDSWSPGSA